MEGVLLGIEKGEVVINGQTVSQANCREVLGSVQENVVGQPVDACREAYCIYSFPVVAEGCKLVGYAVVMTTRPLTEEEINEWIDYLKRTDLTQLEVLNEEGLSAKIMAEVLKAKLEALGALLAKLLPAVIVFFLLLALLVALNEEAREFVKHVLASFVASLLTSLTLLLVLAPY